MRHAALLLALLAACCSTQAEPPPIDASLSQGKVVARTAAKLRMFAPPADGIHIAFEFVDLHWRAELGHLDKPFLFRFLIHLDDDLEGELLADVMAHEWAHVTAHGKIPKGEGKHGPTWGIEYARAFRAIHGLATAPAPPAEAPRHGTGTCVLSGG